MTPGDNFALPGGYVLEVVDLTRRWRVPAATLLAGLGFSEGSLRDPATRVPLSACVELVERAQRLTGEPALALYLGMQMRVSSHGFLGFAAMTSGTVREALSLAERFSATRSSWVGLACLVEGDSASLVIEERAPLGTLRELVVLSLLIGLWQIGQALTGHALDGSCECGFPAPDYIAKIPLASAKLRFDRPAHRLVFPARYLDLPLVTADATAMQLARAQCERELAALVDAGFTGRARAALLDDAGAFRSAPEVARVLHVSVRTLKRKLAAQGTTFSTLAGDLRRDKALLYLEDRELPIAEIAARLGYSEVPNFTRAFRRWTGKTPAAFRRGPGAGRVL